MYPTIEYIHSKEPWRYFWMKYVERVNLNVHCARCLVGEYGLLNRMKLNGRYQDRLDDHKTKYFYICGVHSSFIWAKNFHCAFKFKKGSIIDINENGVQLRILDAERILIRPIDRENSTSPHKDNPAYYTCRNWQFANMIAGEFNA